MGNAQHVIKHCEVCEEMGHIKKKKLKERDPLITPMLKLAEKELETNIINIMLLYCSIWLALSLK